MKDPFWEADLQNVPYKLGSHEGDTSHSAFNPFSLSFLVSKKWSINS